MKLKKIISPPITKFITSSFLRNIKRYYFEAKRKLCRQTHDVYFFFQVDDPYSYLASQLLEKLINEYQISVSIHLVAAPDKSAAPKKKELVEFSLRDAKKIASYHNLDFPDNTTTPSHDDIEIAMRVLALSDNLLTDILLIGKNLWSNEEKKKPNKLLASKTQLTETLEKNSLLRKQLGHYQSAMFYYAGEWYWGVDRLPYLEERIQKLGLKKNNSPNVSHFQKNTEQKDQENHKDLTVEFFISIRSPYSYLALPEILAFEKNYSIKTNIRPVMPMMMRGLAVPTNKTSYIVMDAKRESNRIGVPFGVINDPLGSAVLRGYSLFPYAQSQDKGGEYLLAFCRMAWSEGKDMSLEKNLKYAIEVNSLDWSKAKHYLDNSDWQPSIEENRLQLIKSGLWGVPSFRLINAENKEIFSSWGRDRIWLLTHEINNYIHNKNERTAQ